MSVGLRPFWRYYGGKWRIAPRYPKPRHDTIIEPFAGAAGYSLRYPERQVILVEKYPVIAAIWRWLIAATSDEVRAIPCVDAVADLPDWVPVPARWLVGFNLTAQGKRPALNLSRGLRARKERAWCEGWSEPMRERVASQVTAIRHWKIIDGDYTAAPDIEATWFIDSPYERAGRGYVHGSNGINFSALAAWCRTRRGLVTVCEAVGATWLPFTPFGKTNGLTRGRVALTGEAIWWADSARSQGHLALEASS